MDDSLDNFILSAVACVCERDVGTIGLNTRLDDLRIDSLRMVGIVSQVENVYERRFGSTEILEFLLAERVADLVALMR